MTTYLSSVRDKVLEIPEYIFTADEKKRNIDAGLCEQRIARLTAQQAEAYAAFLAFCSKPEGGMALLKGYAGTGKTFVTSTIIETLLLGNQYQNIAMTAPTNKAVKVCVEMAEFECKSLHYSTIHKLLGLTESIDDNGKQSFIKGWKDTNTIDSVNLLIIDEVSMLSDELFVMIAPYVERNNLKVLFVGDPAQIPPVGKTDCIPFNPEQQDKYKMLIMELTDIVRQAKGNPIIELTLEVRSKRDHREPIEVRESSVDPNGHGIIFADAEDKSFLMDFIDANFKSENFKADSDFVHIVAWRNDTVRKFNNLVRCRMYGKERANSEALIIGEKLIANKPIFEEFDGRTIIIFSNNDELQVEKFEVKTMHLRGKEFKYYSTLVVRTDGRKEHIKIMHEDSELYYIDCLANLKEIALGKDKGTYQCKLAWKDYYAFQQIFADVNYNYAITAHKSQGSSYESVIVLEGDIKANSKVTERNRILYTALSRASKKLIIVS